MLLIDGYNAYDGASVGKPLRPKCKTSCACLKSTRQSVGNAVWVLSKFIAVNDCCSVRMYTFMPCIGQECMSLCPGLVLFAQEHTYVGFRVFHTTSSPLASRGKKVKHPINLEMGKGPARLKRALTNLGLSQYYNLVSPQFESKTLLD